MIWVVNRRMPNGVEVQEVLELSGKFCEVCGAEALYLEVQDGEPIDDLCGEHLNQVIEEIQKGIAS